ncbi:MAG: response regulator [Candidatus Binatia bacterium]|nr:response regulator [Candidatus Binatia bacterium]
MSVQRGSLDSAKQALVRPVAGDPARLVRVFRALQELGVSGHGDLAEQLHDVLVIGCREFDLPVGVLLKIRGTTASVLGAVTPDDFIVSYSAFPLADSYCGAIVEAGALVGFPDTAQAVFPTWPSDPVLHLESYIGVPVRVAGEVYGVVSFGGPELRKEPFSAEEKEILEALAKHLEVVLGGQEYFAQAVTALNEISSAPIESLFEALAIKAAELLDVEYVLVCELDGHGKDQLKTRAYFGNGTIHSTYEHTLAGTPCAEVIAHGGFHCAEGVRGAFPDDHDLVTLGAESYLGAAIKNSEGVTVGQIATLSTSVMPASSRRDLLIGLLASRASGGFERARMERELKEQRELFELASEAGHIGLWDMDLISRTLRIDATARDMLGIDENCPDALQAWRDAIHPADREEVGEVIGAHIRGETEAFLVEHRVERKDGTTRWVLVRGRAVRDTAGRAIRTVSTGFDITDKKDLEGERQRLEAKVQQAQQLESVGVLAGGLTHDFNNLLMGVLGNAGLARRSVQRGSTIDQKIAEIEIAAQRAAELTNQMLAYSGRARFTADSFDLNGLVEEMARLLRTVVSKKAALSLQLGNELLPIEADAAQVRQVVMNLITNASDSLADQPGAVTMATGMRHFDPHFLSGVVPDADLTEGQYAYLEVVDTGVGMDDDTLGRIFDPFFTTKFTGRGLGLAAVLGIMRSHGGGIRVQSAPGEGTRATVIFPPSEAEESMLEDDPGVDDDAWEGQGAVLVVDDEELVRNLMVTILEDAGFEVLTANDGVEALEVFEANSDRIRLILLDMMMPRMNGEEVYTEIRAKNPETSIILMSGFSEEQATRGILGDDAKFLKKPFQINALLDTIQRILDS